ncbi:MAG: hypothetical protein QM695_04390 [Micropruina sp.]
MSRRLVSIILAASVAAATLLGFPATASSAWVAPGTPVGGMRSTTASALSWTPVWGAPRYQVKYSTDASLSSPQYLTTTEPEAELTGLKTGTRYYVAVAVAKTTGALVSPYGKTGSVLTRGKSSSYVTLTPGGLRVTARDGGSLTLAWRARPGVGSYQVRYAADPELAGARHASTTQTTLRLTALKKNTEYWVQLRAKSAAGTAITTFSTAVRATTTTGSVDAPLRAASYNILCANCSTSHPWAKRRSTLVKAIKAQDLDVLGVQEASQGLTSAASGEQKAQFADLLDLLGSRYALTNSFRYNCEKSTSPTNCSPVDRGASHDVRIIYNTDRIAALRHGSVQFADQAPDDTLRFLAWAELRQRASGTRFFVVNTHLDPRDDNPYSQLHHNLRAAQARELVATIKKENTSRLPVIVLGDFKTNKYAVPNNAPYDVITGAGYLDPLGNTANSRIPDRSAIVESRIGTEFNTKNNLTKSAPKSAYINGSVIDYIYVSPGVRVSEWETVVDVDATGTFTTTPPSDHNMVRITAYLP